MTGPARRRRLLSARAADWLLPVGGLAITLVVLQILSSTGMISPIVVPAPSTVIGQLWWLFGEEFFWRNAGVTLYEAGAGFVLGGLVGFLAGTLISLSSLARRTLQPIAVAFQSTPQVALAPLFLIWFGFGIEARIVFAATSCFFPILVSVISGLSAAEADSRLLMRSFGADTLQNYRFLLFPSSLPSLFSGILMAAPTALVGALVGEFVGGNLGLGVMITTFVSQLDMASAFAVIVVLAVLGIAVYAGVELLERVCLRWLRAE